MDDAGAPISYAMLEAGTPVYSCDGVRIGTVSHVLAAEAQDIFDGIIVGHLERDALGSGHGHRFVDAPEVATIHERAVTLTIDAQRCRALPEPTANQDTPADGPSSGISGKLQRAWDLLSGNY